MKVDNDFFFFFFAQVIVDALKQEEKSSSSIPLQTPRDASVTHILVFPTSATAQVSSFFNFQNKALVT